MNIFRTPDYEQNYSPGKLFEKLRSLPGKVVALVVIKAVILYELLKKRDTPYGVKIAIIGVLGYLISPVDAIPDFLPGGFTDDIALMAGLVASLDYLINAELRNKAEAKASDLSGDDDDEEEEDADEELDGAGEDLV